MLLEFSVENFLSIKEKQMLSMFASRADKSLADNLIINNVVNDTLLRSAVVYGANASGKTNLLFAFYTMRWLVVNNNELQPGDPIEQAVPFKFDPIWANRPSKFEINFVHQGIKYLYGFSVDQQKVQEEYLYYYPKKRKALVFRRQGDKYKFTRDKEEQKTLAGRTISNHLYLSSSAGWNYKETSPVFEWFKKYLIIRGMAESNPEWLQYTANKFLKNDKDSIYMENLIQQADMGITSVKVQLKKIDRKELPEDMPDDLKNLLEKKEVFSVDCRHEIEDDRGQGLAYYLPLSQESKGTIRMMELAGYWLEALQNGYVLVVDELDNSLHPQLMKFLVQLFHDPTQNQNNAQLIFSTHDTHLLQLDFFRRDQVWLTEKDSQSLQTELYSLFDIKARNDENIARGYLTGRYGAVPNLGSGIVFEEE